MSRLQRAERSGFIAEFTKQNRSFSSVSFQFSSAKAIRNNVCNAATTSPRVQN
jgi:hypothetical protein